MQPPIEEIDPRFLKWSLLSPQMQADIRENGTGATVLGIKAKLLKKVPLYVPQRGEQKEIADACDTIFANCAELRERFEKRLSHLDSLRESVLQAAFSGQLS